MVSVNSGDYFEHVMFTVRTLGIGYSVGIQWGRFILCPKFQRMWEIIADFRFHVAVPGYKVFLVFYRKL